MAKAGAWLTVALLLFAVACTPVDGSTEPAALLTVDPAPVGAADSGQTPSREPAPSCGPIPYADELRSDVAVEGSTLFLPDGLIASGVDSGSGLLWTVFGGECGSVAAFDTSTGELVTATALPGSPNLAAAGPEGVWVTHWETGDVSRIDPADGSIAATVPLAMPFAVGNGPDGRRFLPGDIALGHGSVWVLTARGALARISAASNRLQELILLPPPHPSSIAVGDHGVWVAQDVAGVSFVKAATDDISTVDLGALDHSAETVAVQGRRRLGRGRPPGTQRRWRLRH